ncbi:MAG: Alanine dehydrogenase [Candidatus Magnetoglobus multicellularis str. Araruama]|uniref:Alanine dehydrogenase n=1 Tax=Candidatus Magnetoglobus multicellularis str. Araruama TaxID=890399 RepID=A0A1V1PH87_9BACT|nr:MAG: Alanine dehydrogenase [Candidatus Magnetoglobus multicellularis str. Araruama]
MKLGVLKEIKPDENRVALQPKQVKHLLKSGHSVYVETNAGIHSQYDNEEYKYCGAIISDKQTVLKNSELILKIKAPLSSEFNDYQHSHMLFSYLHFDENISTECIMKLIKRGFMGIAYEWIEVDGKYPLLEPMSRLTGYLFAQKATELCTKYKGILCGRYESFANGATVLIIGLGNIGLSVLRYYILNKVNILIVDKHPETINTRINERFQTTNIDYINTCSLRIIKFDTNHPVITKNKISQLLPQVDIVLNCAVRRPDLPKHKFKYLIDQDMIQLLSPGSIVCDTTACDRDLIETCISSEYIDKVDIINKVVHYNCDHIPSYIARTSTNILTNLSFPYIKTIADHGMTSSIMNNSAIRSGIVCYKGHITHEYTAEKKN